MEKEHAFDVCECGDYRHQHVGGDWALFTGLAMHTESVRQIPFL
jgi:hypothetical protein